MPGSMATFLMFQDGRAGEAMRLYLSLFDGAAIDHVERWGEGEAGEAGRIKFAAFTVAGHALRCMDSPPVHDFGFTPSASLFVECSDVGEFERLFAALSQGGRVLMPPGAYGFSQRYAWCDDRYGVSWQLNLGGMSGSPR